MAAKIKKGDTVLVVKGDHNRTRGKIGKVIKVFPETNRIIVEDVNKVKKHQRRTSPEQPHGIIEMEAPIHVSNVRLICPNCGNPTRVGFKFLEDGRKVRYCKKCGEVIE